MTPQEQAVEARRLLRFDRNVIDGLLAGADFPSAPYIRDLLAAAYDDLSTLFSQREEELRRVERCWHGLTPTEHGPDCVCILSPGTHSECWFCENSHAGLLARAEATEEQLRQREEELAEAREALERLVGSVEQAVSELGIAKRRQMYVGELDERVEDMLAVFKGDLRKARAALARNSEGEDA